MRPLVHKVFFFLISWWSILLVATVYLLTLCALEKNGFWITDNGNKFLQMRAIIDSKYTDYSIPWPGKSIDSEYTCNPLPHPFSKVKEGQLFSIFSPVFATLSSFSFRLLGFCGLYLLPLVGSLLMLAGLGRMGTAMGLSRAARHCAILIAGLCTPIWFYSVVFWEHTIALCLCVWAVYYYLQFLQQGSSKYLVAGSAAAALSVYFRDELYLFCLVLVGAVVVRISERRVKTSLAALLAMFVSLLPLWLFQGYAVGEPFGFHIASHLFSIHGIAEYFAARPSVIHNLFFASGPSLWFSLAVSIPFLIAFLVSPRLDKRSFTLAVPLFSLVAMTSSLLALRGYVASASPVSWMLKSSGLFTTAPIVMLAFLRAKDSDGLQVRPSFGRWIWLIALAYAALYGVAAPQLGSTGIHWGNRFLLVLYPLFAILAADNLVRWFAGFGRRVHWRVLLTVLVVVLSLAAQLYSIELLSKRKRFSRRLNEAIRERPEKIVITPLWWVPQDLFSEFYSKSIFLVRTKQQSDHLLRDLSDRGYKRFLYVDQVAGDRAESAVAVVNDEGLNFFSLQFFVVDIEEVVPKE